MPCRRKARPSEKAGGLPWRASRDRHRRVPVRCSSQSMPGLQWAPCEAVREVPLLPKPGHGTSAFRQLGSSGRSCRRELQRPSASHRPSLKFHPGRVLHAAERRSDETAWRSGSKAWHSFQDRGSRSASVSRRPAWSFSIGPDGCFYVERDLRDADVRGLTFSAAETNFMQLRPRGHGFPAAR